MKRLFLSIHDVSPYFLKELKAIFNKLDKANITKYNILIVPNWHNSFPINMDKKFIELIESHLHEESKIVLHGYSHSSDKRGHWLLQRIFGLGGGLEFRSIPDSAIESKIKSGLGLLKETFDVKPTGFVPPMWAYSREKENLLKRRFKYYTNYSEVNYFAHKISAVPLAYCGGNRVFDKFDQLVAGARVKTKRHGTLRFTIHPQDVQNGNFKYSLRDLKHLLNKNWKPYLYEDFIEIF